MSQKKVVLSCSANCFNIKTTLCRCTVHRDCNLKCTIKFFIIGIQIGLPIVAGIHQITGFAIISCGLQSCIIQRCKYCASWGVVRINFCQITVHPGGGCRGYIHCSGIIFFAVNSFLFYAVSIIICRPGKP